MGRIVILCAALAAFSSYFSYAQADVQRPCADSLHTSYQFEKAVESYNQMIEDQAADTLACIELRKKLMMAENGRNMSRFVQTPTVISKECFSIDEFFLYYPLEDRSWRPLPNVLDTCDADGYVRALYAPDWNDKLYYSAENENGSRDIMMTMQLDTVWSVPVAEPAFSTPAGNEIFPLLSPDGKTMYFSSDGFYGVGGYDLYKSVWDESAKRWSAPQNLGFPYSSPEDDFLYMETEDGEHLIFASNRDCSNDSVWVYVIQREAFPVHVPVTDPEELQRIAKLDTPVHESKQETPHEVLDNELSVKYMNKMKEVKNLRDSIANASSSLDKLRTDYAFSNDAGERARLTETILGLEMKLPSMQRALDVSNNELRTIEMEFLKEGIFINMNPFEEETEEQGTPVPEYQFRKQSMGEQFNINILVPEVKFDYTFRIEDVAVFAEDQEIPSGVVYQIQLFSGGRKATMAELKGLTPMYEKRTSNGLYAYRVGRFFTHDEAKKNVDIARKRGFKGAYIVAYVDGREVSVVAARTEEASRTNDILLYEVQIIPESGELEPEVVEGMMTLAMGKDIARIETDGGTIVFMMGPFDSKTLAEELAAYVRSNIRGEVKCELLGNDMMID